MTADPHGRRLADLLAFVRDEQEAGERSLFERWKRPIAEKLETGWTQRFLRLERADDQLLWAYTDGDDSRFREGDMLVLHGGSPWDDALGRGLTLESEEEKRWLLGGRSVDDALRAWNGGACFADVDAIDLTDYYERAIEEIGVSPIGREIVLPLLSGDREITFDTADVEEGRRRAAERGFNPTQADAVGLAFGAEQIAAIQGPPGTGKSSVLALIARLMVERGERVLVTSHTHMAINNALNKIRQEGVPTVKIGPPVQRRGLDREVVCCPSIAAWHDRPTDGYVIGATPFATCSFRLEGCEFDAIVFDEASQITVPLALMAMRKGKRFILVGDREQLPPVMLSRSVLSRDPSMSAFDALTSSEADHTVMLDETYRMNQGLTAWPSKTYYGGRLRAARGNRDRRLSLRQVPERMRAVFDPAVPGVFIPTLDRSARAQNLRDGELVAELCAAAVAGGVPAREIGVITPYRAQGRAIRKLLRDALGFATARVVVVDTVERMQGQEREIVILSLATGDAVFLRTVAEFFFQPQRLNVSITRAKSKLIVVGPELPAPPSVGDEQLERWIGEYIQLTRHLTRLTL